MTRGGPFSTKTGSTSKRTTTAHRRSRRSCASWAGTERKRLDEALARQAEEGPAQDPQRQEPEHGQVGGAVRGLFLGVRDRKSTRLNSSHVRISYAVFCLKKK